MSAVSFLKRCFSQAADKVSDRVADFAVSLAARRLSQPVEDRVIIQKFNKIYYDRELFFKLQWLGIPSWQNPCDNWAMQEIITEVKPDFIIETGTALGGTTLFYATVLAQINEQGKILTIDVSPQFDQAKNFKVFKEHVEFMQGSAASPEIVEKIAQRVKGKKVLITLDSKHTKDNALEELRRYAPLVSVGSYLVVQDTNTDAEENPAVPIFGPGPYAALQEFLKTNKDFVSDRSREKYLITFYPSGYLKRIK